MTTCPLPNLARSRIFLPPIQRVTMKIHLCKNPFRQPVGCLERHLFGACTFLNIRIMNFSHHVHCKINIRGNFRRKPMVCIGGPKGATRRRLLHHHHPHPGVHILSFSHAMSPCRTLALPLYGVSARVPLRKCWIRHWSD